MALSDEKLRKYERYWSSGGSGEWVLLGEPGHYIPYNLTTRLASVIEDDELAAAVERKMLEAGVRILDKALPRPPP